MTDYVSGGTLNLTNLTFCIAGCHVIDEIHLYAA